MYQTKIADILHFYIFDFKFIACLFRNDMRDGNLYDILVNLYNTTNAKYVNNNGVGFLNN